MNQDFLKKFINEGNKRLDFIKKQSSDPAIIEVLEKYGRKAEDLEEIFGKLMAGGAGGETSLKVISEVTLLQKYLKLKRDGVNDLEVALVLRKQQTGK